MNCIKTKTVNMQTKEIRTYPLRGKKGYQHISGRCITGRNEAVRHPLDSLPLLSSFHQMLRTRPSPRHFFYDVSWSLSEHPLSMMEREILSESHPQEDQTVSSGVVQ